MKSPDKALTREILLALWKVHILHHANEGPVVGQWMIQELRHHGYEISPGTLYPLLKRMEQRGWLRCEANASAGPRGRREYYMTSEGQNILAQLRKHVAELWEEIRDKSSSRH